MFDKLNIFINSKKKKDIPKNIILEIFSSKYDLAIITFLIYLSWVLYQILKLIWWFTVSPVLWNLYFFSFSNTVNDFLIIFWYTLIIFILTFILILLSGKIINIFKINKTYSNVTYIIWLLVILSLIFWFFFYKKYMKIDLLLIIMLPYIFSSIITYYILTKKKISKTLFYLFFWLFFIYWFFSLLYWSWKYYWCENLIKNEPENCILLDYKNDKYWFTWSGDIYKVEEFKSFYTSEYYTWTVKTK